MCSVRDAGCQRYSKALFIRITVIEAVHVQAASDLAQIFDPFCVEEYFVPSSKARLATMLNFAWFFE